MKNIAKYFFTLILLVNFFLPSCANQILDNIQLPIRDYDGIELQTGTFIPVISSQDISTQYCPLNYKVQFISTHDMYLNDINIIPKDTIFYGYVEEIHEPVVGTHASMKIKITKLTLPDGFENNIKGYIYTANQNLIGGGLTLPAEYNIVPHYQQKFQGLFWQRRGPSGLIRPGATRRMGEHVRINAGEDRLIILTAPATITHTVE